jgi:hypothetical protein
MHIRNKVISCNGKSLSFYSNDGNTSVREFIIIKMTKCHFDNYITW